MNKRITTAQTLELAARIRQFDIVPEFSFVVGNPAGSGTRYPGDHPVYPPHQAAESGCRNYRSALYSDSSSGWHVRRRRRQNHISTHAGRVGQRSAGTTSPSAKIRICRGSRDGSSTASIISSWLSIHAGRRSRTSIFRHGDAVMLKSLSSWRYALGFYEFPIELHGRKDWLLCGNRGSESL